VLGIYYITLERDGEMGEGSLFSEIGQLEHALHNRSLSMHAKIKGRLEAYDDKGVLDALSTLFTSKGYSVSTFLSAKAFLAAPFVSGCIISDVRMPEMTGLDLLRELKARVDPRPIIMITAHDDVGIRERALALGAFAFLRKPFNDELFARTVRGALELENRPS